MKRRVRFTAAKAAMGALGAVLLVFLFTDGETAAFAMRDMLALCGKTVIPSLFPFLVANSLAFQSGLCTALGKIIEKPAKFLFRVGGNAASVFVLGALSGFPLGAVTAVALYEKGQCGKDEAERLLCFCNNSGPGFIVAGIGLSLLGNANTGWTIYFSQLIAAVIVGIVISFTAEKVRTPCGAFAAESSDETSFSFTAAFTKAVGDSALTMVRICAYILFFSVLVAYLPLDATGIPSLFKSLLYGIFEVTSASAAAVKGSSGGAAAAIAFAVGWSGLSVHAQTAAVCSHTDLSLKRYFFAKFLQGLLCTIITAVWMYADAFMG